MHMLIGCFMKENLIEKLRKIIEAEVGSDEMQMLYQDNFALACYLHRLGHRKLGRKMCRQVFSLLGYKNRETYFASILDSLAGNEIEYARDIWPHHEVNELIGILEEGELRLSTE